MEQRGGFASNFANNNIGLNSIVNIFTRKLIFENFNGIEKIFNTKSQFIIKLFLLLPIFFETRDIYMSLIILLIILIINEILINIYKV